MANSVKTPLQQIARLAMLLVCLVLPVVAVAHDHRHGQDNESAPLADSCLFCQGVAQKVGPLPPAGFQSRAPMLSVVGRLVPADSESPRHRPLSLPRVRGPPTV